MPCRPAAARELLDDRTNRVVVLGAEMTAFTRMRVEATDNDLRVVDVKLRAQVLDEYPQHVTQTILREVSGHIAQRQVRGGERDAQVARRE